MATPTEYLTKDGLIYYDTLVKNALAGKADSASAGDKNVVEKVQVNGADLTPDGSKAVNVTVASGVSDGTLAVNGTDVPVTGFAGKAPLASPALTGTPTAPTAAAGTSTTQLATTEFVGNAITNALADVSGLSYSIVEALPASGAAGVIYLVANSGTSPNSYDEYIWVSNAFEKIGTTDVDLSGYVKKADIAAITNEEIDGIVAGTETASA